jgi:nicotinamide riboside kinase
VVQFHSAPVNASAVIRIAITGVESTGKTTLTEALSARLGGVAVRECARYDAEVIAGKATLATLEQLADAQAEACEVAVHQAGATGAACVVSDTDALMLRFWGEHAFDRAPAGLERLETWPDLTLLCAPTIPWEADPLRSMPRLEDRLALHAAYAEAVATLPAYAIIDATAHEKRLDQAVRAFQNYAVNRS